MDERKRAEIKALQESTKKILKEGTFIMSSIIGEFDEYIDKSEPICIVGLIEILGKVAETMKSGTASLHMSKMLLGENTEPNLEEVKILKAKMDSLMTLYVENVDKSKKEVSGILKQ